MRVWPVRTGAWRRGLLVGLVCVAACSSEARRPAEPATRVRVATDRPLLPGPERLAPVLDYIEKTWATLTRTHADLLEAAKDPKIEREPGRPWVVYISAHEDMRAVKAQLRRALGKKNLRRIELRRLPENPQAHMDAIDPHGLLYLPHPYVVPGGWFNEMYGWDSYFIQRGLLRHDRTELARHLVDNHIYQIQHYGMILNANRTYYLTRSQPPFLTSMILGVYERTRDRRWLASTVPAIDAYYAYWTRAPHLAGDTGLSRYFGLGEGPAFEVVSDVESAYYERVADYYRTHEVTEYDESLYYNEETGELTPLFYKGDRAVRESGFDITARFGPFSADIIHYAPVGLNALLYRMEVEAARIHEILGRSREAATWTRRARTRKARINRYLWDDKAGMYMDYDFRTGHLSDYVFATTLYPLWVGAASQEQAARVAANLYHLEAPGGLFTSATITGKQWDAPFGWAPLHLIAIEGLRRYGYHDAADRLAAKFISLVVEEFEKHRIILEKYNLVQRDADVAGGIRYGYNVNVAGFGWTNGVLVELLATMDRLPAR